MTFQANFVSDNPIAGILVDLSQVFLVRSTAGARQTFRQHFSTCTQHTQGLTHTQFTDACPLSSQSNGKQQLLAHTMGGREKVAREIIWH